MILNESKRDELLLPYLNIYKQKTGRDVTLGKFKEMMLYKLGVQGGLQNLSKSSNYYLVGATKYYFNGDLTNNSDLSIFHENFNDDDDWNREIGVRLNACINILRDAYIDSVGTQFEQPEDFGVLTLPKLLKKYNSKINAALGIVTEPKERKKKSAATENEINTNVGNGYTFDILYKYPDATKYNVYTQPGAWCITYGRGHFNGYVKRLNIHYVIFLKNGYENIKRPKTPGAGFTYQKPHDEYGNSMIALLQSNDSWEPIYITSRWNHGAGGISCEADHAYTTQEFLDITGVTVDDLKRIYEIWLKNKDKRRPSGTTRTTQTPEERERALNELRRIKYAQIRINGGEDPNTLFMVQAVLYGKTSFTENPETGNEVYDFRNSVHVCSLRPSEEDEQADAQGFNLHPTYFLVDKGKVIFETVTNALRFPWHNGDQIGFIPAEKYYQRNDPEDKFKMHNLVLFRKSQTGGWMLYDTRRHDFLDIGGIKRFKYLPLRYDSSNNKNDCNQFYQVKLTDTKIALVKISNNLPVRLPNGEFWFNRIRGLEHYYNRYVNGQFCGNNGDMFLAIGSYINGDENNEATYLYSVNRGRFVENPNFEKLSPDFVGSTMDIERKVVIGGKDYACVKFYSNSNENLGWDGVKCLLDSDGNLGKIGPYYLFDILHSPMHNGDDYIQVRPATRYTKQNYIYADEKYKSLVFDTDAMGFVRLPDGEFMYCLGCGTYADEYLYFEAAEGYGNMQFVCKPHPFTLLENPLTPQYPSKYAFSVATWHHNDGEVSLSIYREKPKENAYWWHHDPESKEYFKRVMVTIPLSKLNGVRLNVDKNIDAVAMTPQQQINESNIREMVSEILKRVMKNGK